MMGTLRKAEAGILLIGLLLVGGVSGCQCCAFFDPYADAVDCVASHEHCLDGLYHPGLDLTRIGRPDWCQCGINRVLCPCACPRIKPLPHIIDPPLDPYLGDDRSAGHWPARQPTPEDASAEQSRDDSSGSEEIERDPVISEPYFPAPTPEDRPLIPSIIPPSAESDRG